MTAGVTCNDLVSSFLMGIMATVGGVLVLVVTMFILSRLHIRFPLATPRPPRVPPEE